MTARFMAAILMVVIGLPMTGSALVTSDVELNGQRFPQGSTMTVNVRVRNQTPQPRTVELYVALELFGQLYFHPTYTSSLSDVSVDILGQSRLPLFYDSGMVEVVSIPFPDAIPMDVPLTWYAATYSPETQVWDLDLASATLAANVNPTTPGDVVATDAVVGQMRYVPRGAFLQGSPDVEPCRDDDEEAFQHTLTRNLAVMETEVTRAMWLTLAASAPNLPNEPTFTEYGAGPGNPVQGVTWSEAVLFANILSQVNGLRPAYYTDPGLTTPVTAGNIQSGALVCDFDANGYRLPTEGEWEYLARGGTASAFSFVEPGFADDSCGTTNCTPGTLAVAEQHAVFCANAGGMTATAGSKLANPWGLKDVHGNVMEWCWDWYGDYPTGNAQDYAGPNFGAYRVIRGGSFEYNAGYARSAFRLGGVPTTSLQYIGFRLVRTLP